MCAPPPAHQRRSVTTLPHGADAWGRNGRLDEHPLGSDEPKRVANPGAWMDRPIGGRSGCPIFVVCRRASLTRGSSPAQGNGVREVTNFSLAVIEGSGAGLDRVPVEAALESIFAEEGVSGAAAEVQCVRLVVVPGLAAIELEEEPPRLRYPDVRLPEARPATDTANWCDRVVLWVGRWR